MKGNSIREVYAVLNIEEQAVSELQTEWIKGLLR